MNKIGFDLAQFGNDDNLYIIKSGNSDIWLGSVEKPLGLRYEYDLEDLIKQNIEIEALHKIIFDSESSWFSVTIREEFRDDADEIVGQMNAALKKAMIKEIDNLLK